MKHILPFLFALAALALPFQPTNAAEAEGSFPGTPGLQLYSLREMAKADGVAAAFDQASKFGFKNIETSLVDGMTAAELKSLAEEKGLTIVSMMVQFGQLKNGLDQIVQDAKALGVNYVGCPWLPHKDAFDEAECRAAAEVFNQAGDVLAKNGLKFFYHNHGYEFEPYQDGSTLFDLLVAETDPKTVFFEMDVLWTVLPGQDPAQLLSKYPDRWILMHLKDLKKGVPTGDLSAKTDLTNDVALGTGQVDWPAVFQAAQDAGIEYYFIEDESPTVIDQIPQSLSFLDELRW